MNYPPYWLAPFVAFNESIIAPTTLETCQSIKIADYYGTRLYQPYLSSNELKCYLKRESALYGDNYPVLESTVMCENGFKTSGWSYNNSSYGIAQFRPVTFGELCKGDINSPYDQLSCMARIWKGYKNRWDCFRLGLYKKYLNEPISPINR